MNVLSFAYDKTYEPAMPVVEIGVLGRNNSPEVKLTALVDSGADALMLPINVLQKVGARFLEEMLMRGVIGHGQNVSVYLVNIRIGSHSVPNVKVVAMENTDEVIVGRSVLNQLIITLNGLAEVAEISA